MPRSRKPLTVALFNQLMPEEECDSHELPFINTESAKSKICGVNKTIPKSYKPPPNLTDATWASLQKNVAPSPPRFPTSDDDNKENIPLKQRPLRQRPPPLPPSKIIAGSGGISVSPHGPDESGDSMCVVCSDSDLSFDSDVEVATEDLDHHDKNVIIDGITSANYFFFLWTALEEMFDSKATTLLAYFRTFPLETQTIPSVFHTGFISAQSISDSGNSILHLLKEGIRTAEDQCNLKSIFVHSFSLLQRYGIARDKLLECVNSDGLTTSLSLTRQQWSFLGLLVIDAIMKHAVFPNIKATHKKHTSPQAMWTFNFEIIAVALMGGEESATAALTLRELMTLQQFFDDYSDDDM
jgi:hypothetical protein